MIEIDKTPPDFVTNDSEGQEKKFSDFFGEKKTVLVFYRGDWCPVCNLQLREFVVDFKKFENTNAQIIAISVDDSLKENTQKQKIDADFIFLSDPEHKIIDLYSIFDKGGLTGKIHGKNSYAKPSVFIIDKKGILRYKHVGKHFRDRPKNNELLKILNKI